MNLGEGDILLNLMKLFGLMRFYDTSLNLFKNTIVILNDLS